MPRTGLLILAGLFLSLAVYKAWHDQYSRAQELEDKAIAKAPYFSLEKSEVKAVKNEDTGEKLYDILSLAYRGINDHPATEVHGYLLIIDNGLKEEPLKIREIGIANDLARNAPLNISSPIVVPQESPWVFVFCELIYKDAFAKTGAEQRQAWYLKFLGSSQGVYMGTLPDATLDEKRRLNDYLTKRGIPIP